MNDLRQETIDTYNKSAKELAEYFKGIGPRTDDIEQAFELAGNPEKARVVELGCGDGRDAREIVKRCGWYEGSDISTSFISIARKTVPNTNFVVVDAVTYKFPKNLDIVFAFASLLHLDKTEIRLVLDHAGEALKQGGIFYISLKWADQYQEYIKDDKYGRRLFYLYNLDTISALAGNLYEVVMANRATRGNTEWLDVALRKT